MLPKYILSALFLFISISIDYADTRKIVTSQNWYRYPGNPGVRIRLTKKGINHLKTVAVKLFNEQISGIKGYNSHFPFSQAGLTGVVNLHNVRVLNYRPPQISVANFLPPKYVVLGLENMDLSLAGSFDGTAPPFLVAGDVEGRITGMTVALTAQFSRTQKNEINVRVSNCSTIIQHSHFDIYPTGPTSGLVKAFQGQINDGIRRRIPSMFCKKLKNLIEDNSPALFARLSKAKLGESFRPPITDNSVIQQFINDFVDGLYIDNTNIADPIITTDYFETQMKGEIRYNDSEYLAPFYPRPMRVANKADRMLYFYGSDYLFNSLLYHAYQKNKLNIEINHRNLPLKFKRFVSTTCRPQDPSDVLGGYCVGRLIPAIGEYFPNTTTSFVLVPHGLPDFQFNGDAGAVKVSTRIITYVDDDGHEKQLMVSSADAQADILLKAENGRLYGDLKLNRVNVHLHRASVFGIDPDDVEGLTPLARNFIAPQLTSALNKGLPFPLRDQITFLSPTLRIDDGYVELATDFILDENSLRKKVKQVFNGIKI